ncbi:hypothetical protein GOV11_01810, partial [Candidatus Woesearchaeota archaeon]|nr:hypothetical protein [Candidatus Woesearchaeota archaeon]
MELTSLDVRYVARELATMEGAKVEKVFQSKTDRKDILLVLYQKERPKLYLRMVPGMVCLQEEKPAYPQVPPAFAMFLRKYMKSAR